MRPVRGYGIERAFNRSMLVLFLLLLACVLVAVISSVWTVLRVPLTLGGIGVFVLYACGQYLIRRPARRLARSAGEDAHPATLLEAEFPALLAGSSVAFAVSNGTLTVSGARGVEVRGAVVSVEVIRLDTFARHSALRVNLAEGHVLLWPMVGLFSRWSSGMVEDFATMVDGEAGKRDCDLPSQIDPRG